MALSFEQLFSGEASLADEVSKANHDRSEVFAIKEAWSKKDFVQACLHLARIEPAYKKEAFYWFIYGRCCIETRQHQKALNCLGQAHNIDSANPDYFHFKGIAHQNLSEYEEAKDCYLQALSLESERPLTLSNLSCVYEALGNIDAAMAHAERALNLNSSDPALVHNYAIILAKNGNIEEGVQFFQKNTSSEKPLRESISSQLYHQLFLPDAGSRLQTEQTKHLVAAHFSTAKNNDLRSNLGENKIRIGYLSSDFRRHSCAFFIEPILRHHTEAFETFVFHNSPYADNYTHHFQTLTNQWFDVYSMSDENLVDLIRAQNLDIIIDLNGHTGGNRMAVLGQRVAPVQINYLGYAHSTWLPEMDYRLVDWHTDPKGSEPQNSETLLRMPASFLAYEPLIGTPEITPPPSLQKGHVTFGSFNNPMKISQSTAVVWAELLRAVPTSTLQLKSHCLRSQNQRDRLSLLFQNEGISSERLYFLDPVDDDVTHLESYNGIDIALDTFPYNGTTTTIEALLMGTPVLTLCGNSHRSRVGNSILANLGLQDLMAKSPQDFVNQGQLLAKNPQYLAALSSSLRFLLSKSPIMQHAQFMSQYENILNRVVAYHRDLATQTGS